MTRRIMALLMAMVMVFGFGVVSRAEEDEVKYYEGTVSWEFLDKYDYETVDITGKVYGDIFEFEFTDSKGNYVEWKSQKQTENGQYEVLYIKLNGEETQVREGNKFYIYPEYITINVYTKVTYDNNNYRCNARFNLVPTPVGEVKYYEGVVFWQICSSNGDVEENIPVVATLSNDMFEFGFTDNGGNYVEWKAEGKILEGGIKFSSIVINKGEPDDISGGVQFYSDYTVASVYSKGCYGIGPLKSFTCDGEFKLVDKSNEPAAHEISTPFTGTAISDRDEYTLALAGYFEKELADGTHVLTPEEINAQTISIVAYNKANGVKRVMTQSTIEEMSVTVSGGEVTQYVIRGRVQTSGGKLDRYTVVIEQ